MNTFTKGAFMSEVTLYGLYLGFSLALTVWVGRTLFRHGRLFLVRVFGGEEALADSVNHLLLTGWYLVNGGWVLNTVRDGTHLRDISIAGEAMTVLSTKVGGIALLL